MKVVTKNQWITMIVVLAAIECSLVGYIGWWRGPFWEAVSNKDLYTFIKYLGYFSIAALTACYVSSKSDYCQSTLALLYRNKLSSYALGISLRVEGHEQRIQEDCFTYPLLCVRLLVGGAKNLVLLIVFMSILYSQTSVWYLVFPIGYALVGTLLAAKLANPLIELNYINQVFEAKFRRMLCVLTYHKVFRNNVNLFRGTKKLAYFQYFYNQITVIVPYIILASLYFSGKIVFGAFMQCAASMSQAIECLSYIINSFNDVNKLISCRRRLKELGAI